MSPERVVCDAELLMWARELRAFAKLFGELTQAHNALSEAAQALDNVRVHPVGKGLQ